MRRFGMRKRDRAFFERIYLTLLGQFVDSHGKSAQPPNQKGLQCRVNRYRQGIYDANTD